MFCIRIGFTKWYCVLLLHHVQDVFNFVGIHSSNLDFQSFAAVIQHIKVYVNFIIYCKVFIVFITGRIIYI